MARLDVKMWLKSTDLGEGDTLVTIESEARLLSAEITGFKSDVHEIDIKLPNGESRTWTVSDKNLRSIATVHGTEMSAWIGKPVTLFKQPMNVKGKMTDVIYARAT